MTTELTPERLAELRRVAEAALAAHDDGWKLFDALDKYSLEFDPSTCLALLAELEAKGAELLRLRQTISRVGDRHAALGQTDDHPGITVRHVHLQVAGEMMNVLTGPETPEQAEARLADHAEVERLDRMQAADDAAREAGE